MPRRTYYVYIMTNRHHTVLYTGMTNHLERRMHEHKDGCGSQFTRRYNVRKLVYFEKYTEVNDAIIREKQIKSGSRQKKLDLINDFKPRVAGSEGRFSSVNPSAFIAVAKLQRQKMRSGLSNGKNRPNYELFVRSFPA